MRYDLEAEAGKAVARRLVKAGLTALLPVGQLADFVIDEVPAVLVEAGFSAASNVGQSARTLIRNVAISLDQLRPMGVTLVRERGLAAEWSSAVDLACEVLERHGLALGEWVEAQFDALKATEHLLAKALQPQGALAALTDADVNRCRQLLVAFHAAFLADRTAWVQLEIAFRDFVLARLAQIESRLGTAMPDAAVLALARGVARELVAIPRTEWVPSDSPSALLRAEVAGGVPFFGRVAELEDLREWRDGATSAVGVRLYTGAGGMGKTRLLIEACRAAESQGWHAGFLAAPNATRSLAESCLTDALIERLLAPPDSLVVIDYADRKAALTSAVLRHARKRTSGRLRIVLLARTSGTWWDALRERDADLRVFLPGTRTRVLALDPVTSSSAERAECHAAAVEHFSMRLRRPADLRQPDLSAEHYGRILLIHMRALAAVHGAEEGPTTADEARILTWTLDRERGFWADRLSALNLPAHHLRGVTEVMAVLTLGGGASSRAEAQAVVGRVLRDEPRGIQEAIAELLHETYPGDGWIAPLQPDILGEHLIKLHGLAPDLRRIARDVARSGPAS